MLGFVLLGAFIFYIALDFPISLARLGKATVRMSFAVLIAYGLRSLYLRARKKQDQPIWSIWVLVIALFVVPVVAFISDKRPPSDEQVQARFIDLEGYTYEELPPDVAAGVEELGQKLGEEAFDTSGVEGRMVMAKGLPTVAMIFGVDPDVVPDLEAGSGLGLSQGGLSNVLDYELNGHVAFAGRQQGGEFVFVIHEDGYIFFVGGSEVEIVRDIATELTAF
jgi:hypothetical protein